MKNKFKNLLSIMLVCFCCSILVQGNMAQAREMEDAESCELGEKYEGNLSWTERYYQFEITEKSHVTLKFSKEVEATFAEIYDLNGKMVLSAEDLVYKKNELTGWNNASQYRTLSEGNYYLKVNGVKEFNFIIQAEPQIKLPKGSITSLKSKKAGQVSIAYKGSSNALGYRIQYSTDMKFKKGVKTIKTSSTKGTIKGLKKGAKYYVKVCPYSVYDDGVVVYGKNSTVKAVKVKK